jgi:hypothetical protein
MKPIFLLFLLLLGANASCVRQEFDNTLTIENYGQVLESQIDNFKTTHPGGAEDYLFLTPDLHPVIDTAASESHEQDKSRTTDRAIEIVFSQRPRSDLNKAFDNIRLCLRSKLHKDWGVLPDFWIVFSLKGKYMVTSSESLAPEAIDKFLAEMRGRREMLIKSGNYHKMDMDDAQFEYLESVAKLQ